MTALAREMAQGASGSIRDLVSKTEEVLMDWLDPNGAGMGLPAHPTERQTVTFRQLDDVWNITAIGAQAVKSDPAPIRPLPARDGRSAASEPDARYSQYARLGKNLSASFVRSTMVGDVGGLFER